MLRFKELKRVLKNRELIIIRIIVGIVFILSAISKLRSPGIFEIILIDQGFTANRLIAAYLTRILISMELFIGVSFFQPFLLKRVVAPLTLAALTSFSIYTLYLMAFAANIENCGCFGEVVRMSPFESLLKNIVLIGLVSYLFIRIEPKKERWYVPAVILVASFWFAFSARPVRSLADNVFAKYTRFVERGRVDLTQGDKLVAVMDVNCEHCQAAARELGELDRNTHNLPPIYILFFDEDGDSNSVEHFFHLTSTRYPYHLISVDEFFDLIGSAPPRIYWLRDGKIRGQWDQNMIENLASAFKMDKEGVGPQ